MHVVATAGHVDHGKSTLVEALTGMHPDRLEEEHRRGLSIELGYCWTTLTGVGQVAFVDVPGHERFVTTTLAGLGPVPAVMLVVAADDPWMPQAAEHLAALDALQVAHGVLAVTRSDLADPAPALARARQALAATSLRDIPAVTVSGRTGAGLDDLARALATELSAVPDPDPGADVRLWVDRRFHVRGAGTVVTGTLVTGTVRPGDSLAALGGSSESRPGTVRVRGIECLGEPVVGATGVARVALDLGGRAPVDRGSVLVSPGAFETSSVVDVRLRGVGAPPERPVLHVGATSVGVHARPLSDQLARLRVGRALPLRIGDRAILRDPGSRTVWGVEVVDPAPPSVRRRGAAALRAEELATADGTVRDEVGRRGVVRRSLLARLGARGGVPTGTLVVGDWLVSAGRAEQLRAELQRLVTHGSTATRPGVPVAQLTRSLDLPDDRVTVALVGPGLRVDGAQVVPETTSALPEELAVALRGLRADLAAAPFVAPDADRLRALGLDAAGLAALARAGRVLPLGGGLVLLPGADDRAVERLATLASPFTVSEARQVLGSTRRAVLPLLAHLDRTGRTLRLPDDRRRLR